MQQHHYYYIIFGASWDLYKHSYSDVNYTDYAKYISFDIVKATPIRHFHFSNRINQYIHLPFKSIWNYKYFTNPFPNDRPLCFIFTRSWIKINKDIHFIKYLKKKYPNAKFVCFLQDLFKFLKNENFEEFDLKLSFDYGDCQKYGFIYHPLVFSEYKGKITDMPHSDIYFLGKAKDRMPEIIRTYEILKEENLDTDFNLVGVPSEKQVYKDDIQYIDIMPYMDNLQHVIHSSCVLEIMQGGGLGYTQRGLEILGMNKKLLTNNQMVHTEPYFNPKFISQFDKPENIDREFLRHIKDDDKVDYHYKDKISPLELLDFIDNKLS